jgi:hypothetical protein
MTDSVLMTPMNYRADRPKAAHPIKTVREQGLLSEPADNKRVHVEKFNIFNMLRYSKQKRSSARLPTGATSLTKA